MFTEIIHIQLNNSNGITHASWESLYVIIHERGREYSSSAKLLITQCYSVYKDCNLKMNRIQQA